MNSNAFYLPLIAAAVFTTACQTSQPKEQASAAIEAASPVLEQSTAPTTETEVQPMRVTRVWTIQVGALGALTGDDMLQVVDTIVAEVGGWQHLEGIEIIGHTDDLGSSEVNQALSVKRADAVAEQFLMAGVDEQLLAHRGEGESQPLVPNDDDSARANNRRVEIRVSGLAMPVEDAELARGERDEFSLPVAPQVMP